MERPESTLISWFRKKLLLWYAKNGRTFPWRQTRDPYKVLISELMLRRTRADQVVPVFQSFVRKYPTVAELQSADPPEIKGELKPLGLNWRADNVVALVAEVGREYGTAIPTEKARLMELPGVGQYVAGAVRCFALEEPEALIDTNIVRVVGRFFGLSLKGEARRRREMIQAITSCIPRSNVRNYYYAIIDLAAAVCLPRKPECEECPLALHCCFPKGKNS